jgi:hypothetical protein
VAGPGSSGHFHRVPELAAHVAIGAELSGAAGEGARDQVAGVRGDGGGQRVLPPGCRVGRRRGERVRGEFHGGVAEPGRGGGDAGAQFRDGLGPGRRVTGRDEQDRDAVEARASGGSAWFCCQASAVPAAAYSHRAASCSAIRARPWGTDWESWAVHGANVRAWPVTSANRAAVTDGETATAAQ